MTDPQNHLDLARTDLEDARNSYSDTNPKFAVIENALMGIGHALLAIHDQMLAGSRAAAEYADETDRIYEWLNPGKSLRAAAAPEPPADISGIDLETDGGRS